jgi:hypothetical protein
MIGCVAPLSRPKASPLEYSIGIWISNRARQPIYPTPGDCEWCRVMVLLGPRKWMDNLPSKMHRKKRTSESEECPYYSRVEPHIGHLLPRSKSQAPLEHLNQHWTRLGYRLNSLSMPPLEESFARQKVQGVHMLQIEVPAHNEWPGQAHHGGLSVEYPGSKKTQGSTATDRLVYGSLTSLV